MNLERAPIFKMRRASKVMSRIMAKVWQPKGQGNQSCASFIQYSYTPETLLFTEARDSSTLAAFSELLIPSSYNV